MKKYFLLSAFVFLCLGLALPSNAQPFDYCTFETKEGAQCPASRYAGKQTPYDAKNCSGTAGANQVCCCTKEPEAQDDSQSPNTKTKPSAPVLQVSIPGLGKFSDINCDNPEEPCTIPWLAEYIGALYKYSLVIIGLLAVIVMMIGGVRWLTAGGAREAISDGMNWIKGGLLGIIFALCSYLVLFIINPNLTLLQPLNINYIGKVDLETIDTVSDVIDAPTDNLKYPDVKIYNPKSEKPSNVKGCDDCVVTSLPTKNNKNVNQSLNAKLLSVRTSVSWRITEAYPPTSPHQSKCHYNGRCVDIGLTSEKNCTNFFTLMRDFEKAGLNVFNETGCGDTHSTKFGTGAHIHVRE